MTIHFAALTLGFLLDLLLGDPHWAPHPIRGIGHLISSLEKLLRRIFPQSPRGLLIGGFFLVVLTAGSGTPLTGYGVRELFMGLALAVLCTLLGHSLFSWCLKYLSPSYVSAAKLCEPVFSTLAAIPLFHEVPTPLQLIGGVIVLGSVLLYTRAERPETDE